MRRSPLLVANWKMHGTKVSTRDLLMALKSKACSLASDQAKLIVLPPTIFLDQTECLLKESPILWGAQDMAGHCEGAYTGELSGMMLKEFGCRYVLLGHSERRQYYNETDAHIAKKWRLAQQLELIPILCVGETLAQYQAGVTQQVLQQQLNAVLFSEVTACSDLILAYEPIWAIGTGLAADPQHLREIHAYLKAWVTQHHPRLAPQLRILYGGSLKPSNAKDLFTIPNVDGGLVGQASLNASMFWEIYQALLNNLC